ncbi:F0F1 ATP synthase subunit A [Wenjunlia tyrosinilytica]|uniref:ATP synthase subunit a n=1 Tax=Wenjunlia tyrosinilytica TaxID=1544741 RepID=A0A917ZSE1_9ACTN|nr:F0F1 ATP synthase subunit A [Wenjunlia tyrosinilytica]GGO92690.1 ATP synthase subunit a [Wenjunlia tyrosinilytica]
MSADPQMLANEIDCHIFADCGFPSPGLNSFMFKPMFEVGGIEFNKPMLLALISTIVVTGFFWAAFARPKVVPGKLQMVGEAGYDFVRRGIVYETMGKKDGEKYVPLMVSLFFFIWLMNLWSIIPFAQFPVTSLIAFPAGLAALVWFTWMTINFKKHGFVGGIKNLCYMPGLPKAIYPLLIPIEFLSNVIVRPFTHAVRLFANMFAGHLLLVIFTIASWYLLNGVGIAYAGVSFVMVIVMTLFEIFVQALQAYVFVLLASSYIQGALHADH